MKKLVFAAIATMVMVTVSNVFASNKVASVSCVASGNMVAPVDTVTPADTLDQTPVQPVDTTSTDTTVAQ